MKYIGAAVAVVVVGVGIRILLDERATFAFEIWLGTVATFGLGVLAAAFIVRASQPKRAPRETPQAIDGAFTVVNTPQLGKPGDAAHFTDAGATQLLGVQHDIYTQ